MKRAILFFAVVLACLAGYVYAASLTVSIEKGGQVARLVAGYVIDTNVTGTLVRFNASQALNYAEMLSLWTTSEGALTQTVTQTQTVTNTVTQTQTVTRTVGQTTTITTGAPQAPTTIEVEKGPSVPLWAIGAPAVVLLLLLLLGMRR